MKLITISSIGIKILNKPTPGRGGWQSLMRLLRRKLDSRTGIMVLTNLEIDRIFRYAYAYGNGGWEKRLRRIFGSHLDFRNKAMRRYCRS